MSSKTNISLFPELNTLKRTLWEVQGQFRETKPNLDAALAALAPAEFDSPLDELEAQAKLNLTGEIPKELAEALADLREAYKESEAFLADPEKRNSLITGNADTDALNIMRRPLVQNYKAAEELLEPLEKLSYGAAYIEQQHKVEIHVGMVNLALNRVLEMLDLRPPLVDAESYTSRFLEAIISRLGQLVQYDELAPTWDLLSAWLGRWGEDRGLAEIVRNNVAVGKIEMNPPRNIDNYAVGDILLTVDLYFGQPTNIEVAEGFLPLGLELDRTAGQLKVSDPDKLFPGEFSGLQLKVENDQGFGGVLNVPDIIFGEDFEAKYTVFSPKQLDKISEGEILAYPTDPDGAMIGAQITGGRFPAGVRFDTRSGEFTLTNPDRVVAGTYKLQVSTFDDKGGQSTHQFEIEFVAPPSVEVSYDTAGTFRMPLFKGDVLGTPKLSNGFVSGTALLSGRIPPGTQLLKNGQLIVVDSEMIEPTTYGMLISVSTSIGPVLSAPLKIEIQESKTGK